MSSIFAGSMLGLLNLMAAARADAIPAWSGASATAGASTQSGATASASDTWSRTATARAPYWSGTSEYIYQVPAHGSSSARAGGPFESLLQVNTTATMANPGSSSGWVESGGSAASASWTNDALVIRPLAGEATPSLVRLQLSLTFDATPSYLQYTYEPNIAFGSIGVQANGTAFLLNRYGTDAFISGPASNPSDDFYQKGLPFVFDKVVKGPDETVATFHIDLPVDPSGKSDPFSLALSASSLAASPRNLGMTSWHNTRLGISGVTFADGTPLIDRGVAYAFASTGAVPEFVPEPASVAAWTLLGLAGIVRFRRGKRSARHC